MSVFKKDSGLFIAEYHVDGKLIFKKTCQMNDLERVKILITVFRSLNK